MDIELKKQKSEILKYFLKWNYQLYLRMNMTDHSFDSTNITPYHLEGNVWTHTMCVLQSEYIKTQKDIIAALCHDFGKCDTRFIRYDDNIKKYKVSFRNHEEYSVAPCNEFLIYLRSNNFNLSNKDVDDILFSVKNHLKIYDIKDNKIAEFCNFDQDRANCLLTLMKADHDGQIVDYSVKNNLKFEINESAFNIKFEGE